MDTISTDSQFRKFMDRVGYDPTTSALSRRVLYQLSYRPWYRQTFTRINYLVILLDTYRSSTTGLPLRDVASNSIRLRPADPPTMSSTIRYHKTV